VTINLALLDDKIRQLQMIRQQLASDPELAPLLKEVLIGNGASSTAPASSKELKGVRRDVFKSVPENSDQGNYQTSREIADKMKTAGYKFKSQNHRLTVKEQLRELEGCGLVEKAGTREDGSALWRKTAAGRP